MAIDISKMRNKLDALKGGGKQQNAKFWSPQEGVQTIRILPTGDGDPFKSFFFHYGFGKESILCPKGNFGDPCPICDFAAKLYNDKDEESREMASKIVKKQRFFSPVLVRGDEKDGPKIWGYSKSTYQFLIETVLNPEYGDVTDLEEGVDIDLEYGKKSGKKFPETKLTLKRRSSPMCKDMDPDSCKDILARIPDFDKLHKRRPLEEIKTLLEQFLNGTEGAEADDSEGVTKFDEASSVDAALKSLRD
jgi:hypothetical protein